ncbi:MAG: response regulator, partial [Proteobacteria bacterium]|nr:response regulator [Pseudomonadota bacterium]
MKPVKLLIVDDSAVVRQVLTQVFAQSPDIRVIAAAPDPLFALEKMRSEWPDVIVLDVEMPRMDGITFLRKLMSERPTPVIICSTLTAAGTQTSIDALAAGALQIVTKPTMGLKQFLQESAHELIQAVR